MIHTNAALTPRHRLKVAQLVVDEHWPISEVAARFQVSWPTVKRWVLRYKAGESMQDAPHAHTAHRTRPTSRPLSVASCSDSVYAKDLYNWPTGWVSLPPRSIGYFAVPISTGCHTQIGQQVNRSEDTNTTILDQCCMSM